MSEAHLVLNEISEAGIPVLVHPTMAHPTQERENQTFEMPQLLHEAGILFAQRSGYEPYVPMTWGVRIQGFPVVLSVIGARLQSSRLKL